MLTKNTAILAILLGLACSFPACAQPLKVDPEDAQKLRAALPRSGELLLDGKVDEANKFILAVFPEAGRTPSQAFMLANVLYPVDPEESYAMHKLVAEKFPADPAVQFEWGMECHRKGEWAGALKAYKVVSDLPDDDHNAIAFGLSAECLIRLGKVQEACAAWKSSEEAHGGTIEDFESMVCEVHHMRPERKRAELLAAAAKGDIAAAEQLITLDAAFDLDWWNKGPKRNYLKHDEAVVRNTRFADAKRAQDVVLAADACRYEEGQGDGLKSFLAAKNCFVGDQARLPASGAMARIIAAQVTALEVMSEDELRTKFGDAIQKQARKDKNIDLYHLASLLYLGKPEAAPIARDAYRDTGDVAFAISMLLNKLAAGGLKLDDPFLQQTFKKFPENGYVAGLVVRLTPATGNRADALVKGIKAEYSGFSLDHGAFDTPRPGAKTLRAYFLALIQIRAAGQ